MVRARINTWCHGATERKARRLSYSPAPAMASRWSLRSVLTASRARHRSALAMVIAALASALVTL